MPRLCVIAADPLQGEDAALAWLPGNEQIVRRSGDELDAAQLFADLGQPGMFAEERLLLYSDVLAAKLNKKETERIAALLAHLPAETHLACVQLIQEETRQKAETRLKSAGLRLFADGAELLDIRSQAEGSQASRWLVQRAQARYGLRLELRQAQQILAVNANSPAQAEGVLLKLSLLKSGDESWTVPDMALDTLLSGSPAARFFELVELLLRQPQAAQPMLLSWYNSEPETFRLIFELKRRLMQARSASRGAPVYPPFAAREAQRLAGQLSGRRFGQVVEALATLEHALKSGAYPAESSRQAELGALQLFAADLARAMRS